MACTLTRAEQETHIRWDAEEKVAHIYTCDPAVIRKLDRLVEEYPELYTGYTDTNFGKRYLVSAKYIRFGKPRAEMSEEQKQANSERFKRMWEAKHAQES